MTEPGAPAPDVYRWIVDHALECAAFFLETNGRIRTWNSGAQRIFGYTETEAVGQPSAFLYRPRDRESGLPELDLSRAAAGDPIEESRLVVRKSGMEFWADDRIYAVRDAESNLTGYVRLVRDATFTRKLQAAAERATDELGRFAFTVSHDLQEPLRSIRSYSELLQRRYKGKLDADADEFINFVVEGTTRMGQLLKDILAYSQAGREDRTRPESTPAGSILQWALMNLDPVIKDSGAKVTTDPLPTVHVDQSQLATLFQQLIGNSIKFRSEAPPEIHISAREVNEETWEFAVRDNGIGVDPQHTERVFGVFKRLVGRDVPGTGIGLSICRKIVEAHGGRIWMESEPGQSATVKFTLPAA